ncbi:MAG: hypothetical protein IKP88_03665 [Lachnospiraceae bacterium]|nr:hypothetical protein [Lachnospiraceae bacterium]
MAQSSKTQTPSVEELKKENEALLGDVQNAKNVHFGCAQARTWVDKVIGQVVGELRDLENTYCPNCKTHTQYEYDLNKIKEDIYRVLYENEMIISLNAFNEILQKHS